MCHRRHGSTAAGIVGDRVELQQMRKRLQCATVLSGESRSRAWRMVIEPFTDLLADPRIASAHDATTIAVPPIARMRAATLSASCRAIHACA